MPDVEGERLNSLVRKVLSAVPIRARFVFEPLPPSHKLAGRHAAQSNSCSPCLGSYVIALSFVYSGLGLDSVRS